MVTQLVEKAKKIVITTETWETIVWARSAPTGGPPALPDASDPRGINCAAKAEAADPPGTNLDDITQP